LESVTLHALFPSAGKPIPFGMTAAARMLVTTVGRELAKSTIAIPVVRTAWTTATRKKRWRITPETDFEGLEA
jgi:hypothetical protein